MRLLPAAAALVLLAFTAGALSAQVPPILNYQGRVAVSGTNFDGTGQFKFALVDDLGTTTYWSNDGSSLGGTEPTAAVSLPVAKGLYSIPLGDVALANMTEVPGRVFGNPDVRLRVWFNDGANGFQLLTPDQRVTAVGYAQIAAGVELPLTDTSGRTGVIRQNGLSLLHTFGTLNAFGGTNAGNFTLTGEQNTGFGVGALASLTAGGQNAAFGINGLYFTTTGSANTSMGWNALIFNVTGSSNTAIGSEALYTAIAGVGNTALGRGTLSELRTGDGNIAVGSGAGAGLLNGSGNIYLGNGGQDPESNVIRIGSGQTDTYLTGVIHGDGSGLTGLTGGNFSSDLTLAGTTSGSFSGSLSGNATTATSFAGPLTGDVTGSQGATVVASVGGVSAANVATGTNLALAASSANTASALVQRDGSGNFSAGTITATLSGNATSATSFTAPLAGDVTGPQAATVVATVGGVTAANVAAGANLANAATSGNTANALMKRDASGNFSAGSANLSGSLAIPDTSNPAVGVILQGGTRLLHTFGNDNFYAGRGAGNFTNTGRNNLGVGPATLSSVTTGDGDTAVGHSALLSNTTGTFNTAFGAEAAASTTTGSQNTAVGLNALNANVTGGNNVAVGDFSLNSATATRNVAIGSNAASNLTTGGSNIVLGAFAGSSLTTGSNDIVIGHPGVAGESNAIRIGTVGTQTTAFVAGISGVTSSGGAAVFVNGNGQLGTVTSSRRFKDDIRDMGESSEALLALRPVTFRYKPEIDAARLPQSGLIAEEVAEVNPDLVIRDETGAIQTVRYEQVNAMLLNEFLKDHQRLAAKDAEIRALQAQNALLQQRLAAVEAQDQARDARIARLEKLLLPSPGVQAVALKSSVSAR